MIKQINGQTFMKVSELEQRLGVKELQLGRYGIFFKGGGNER